MIFSMTVHNIHFSSSQITETYFDSYQKLLFLLVTIRNRKFFIMILNYRFILMNGLMVNYDFKLMQKLKSGQQG